MLHSFAEGETLRYLRSRPTSVLAVPWVAALLLLSFTSICASAGTSSNDPLALFEKLYQPAHSLSAAFLERFIDNGQIVRDEAGHAYFLRPGKMRWEYERPEKNLFLMDGKYVWFYAPADRTVTRVPANQSEDWRTPLAFLTSGAKLSRVCASIRRELSEPPSGPDAQVFSCKLRATEPVGADAPVQTVLFELRNNGELTRLRIDQGTGQAIEFRFRQWEWNPSLDKALFTFTPPTGVAIVNGLLPDPAAGRPN